MLNFVHSFFGNHKHRISGGDERTINKDFLYRVLDTDPDPILFFTKEEEWIGANKAFFDLVPLQNIEQLRNNHDSIRELFDHEDEEVFTEPIVRTDTVSTSSIPQGKCIPSKRPLP